MSTLIAGNGRVITRDAKKRFFNCGAVAVEGNLITDVGNNDEIRAKYKDARFIDARGGVIMPGLINAHNHIYSAFARGLSVKGYAPRNFPEILDGLWWRLDKNLNLEDTHLSAMAAFLDCIKNGCTTVFDHHASYGEIPGSLFKIAQAADFFGVRASLCYEVSDRAGIEKRRQAVDENVQFIKYVKDRNNDMLKAMMGLHASFTLCDKSLELCRDNTPDDIGFHIHVAEGIEDENDCMEKSGKRVVNRLYDMGILGRLSVAGHCIHIDGCEMELLKHSDTMVVHNPESNMGNAVGIPPCMELMRRGILTGLGTDGYTNDMFESEKVANIIHKHVLKDPGAAWSEVPQMLFENNAAMCSRFFGAKLGVLEPGAAADIVISDYIPLTPMDESNYEGHLLFGMSGRSITATIINGDVKMENRVLIGFDEEEIMAKCRENADKLWKRINM